MFRCLCIIVLIRLLGFWYLISHENVDKNGSVEAQIIYKDHNYYEAIILSKDINPFILNHYINFYHEAPLDKGSIYLLSYAIKTKHFRYSWFSQVFDRTHDQVILNSLPIFVSYGQKSLREKWIIYLDKIIPEHTLRPLVRALIWGDRQGVSDQIYGLFTQTGTAHILAISGLHVAWVVCMFTGLMQSIPLAIIIGWLYVIFAMLPPSGVRAMLMVTLDYMFPKLGWIYIFIFTLLIHLLIFPIDIFSMSTLLSYWAIIMIRFITVFTEGGLFGFSINLSLLMMPISLYFFHQWPIASLWLNLMVVPLFSFIVLPLILFSLFASFLGITSLWNIVYGVLLYVVKLLQYFESWPKIYLFDHLFLSAFVIQASLIYFMVKRPNWLVVVCLVFIFYLVVHHPIKVPYNNFSIVMLDVGQGLSVWIKTKHHAVLYDAGPKYAGYKVLLPFIMSQKPNELSHIIISHWDQDHVGGLTAIRSKTKAKIITSEPALGEPCLYGQSFE